MPWKRRSRPCRWAYILLLLSCCCVFKVLYDSSHSAGAYHTIVAAATGTATSAATARESSESIAPWNYGSIPPLGGARGYLIPSLNVREDKRPQKEELQQHQQGEQSKEQSPEVIKQSLQQQQQASIPPLQQLIPPQRQQYWQESYSLAPFSEVEGESPISLLREQQRPLAVLYPERPAVLSHLQQQHLSHQEKSQQQNETQKSQPPPFPSLLRSVKHHYNFGFPLARSDSRSTAQPSTTPPTAPDLPVNAGAAGRGDATDFEKARAGATAGEETEKTPLRLPPAQLQKTEEQEQPRQQQQQQLYPAPKATESGKMHIPFFSALAEDSWNYKQHGRDWGGMCAEGRRQSPVDLHIEGLPERQYRNLTDVYRRAFQGEGPEFFSSYSRRPWKRGDFFYYYPNHFSTLQIYRTDKVFQLRAPPRGVSALGALLPTDTTEMLMAQHIFFHSPSEHTFQGEANRRQVEMQIWHFSNDPVSFHASTNVNRATLPYLALFAEGSLDLNGGTAVVASSSSSPFSPRLAVAVGGKADEYTTSSQNKRDTEPEGGNTGADILDDVEGGGGGEKMNENIAARADGMRNSAGGGITTEGEAENNYLTDTDMHAEGGKEAPTRDLHAEDTTGSTRQHPAGISALEIDKADAGGETPGASRGDSSGEGEGVLRSPTAHWRVVSLTFMSEELDQATVEDLKSLPSERLISSLLEAEKTPSGAAEGEMLKLKRPLNLQALMMMLQLSNTEFFAYDGSSTMPPCEENVRWYVARQPLPIATETMLRFYKMLNPFPVTKAHRKDGNFRSLQNVDPQRMHNEGNVYLVQGFPVQLLVAASLGFDAMAKLPQGEAPTIQRWFSLPSSSSSATGGLSRSNSSLYWLLLFLTALGVAELVDAKG